MSRHLLPRPDKVDLVKLYVREQRSIRDIAEIMDCSKDLISRALDEYGIARRNKTNRRSQLMDYDRAFLEREIEQKGLSQVAREIGVHKSTLMRFMRG